MATDVKFTTIYDLRTKQGCMGVLADMRHTARLIVSRLDAHGKAASISRRSARLLRRSGDAMEARRASVIDARIEQASQAMKSLRDGLEALGERFFYCAPYIDSNVPRCTALDLLNVNPLDRGRIAEGDGIVNVVFVHGLENSAEGRGKDFLDTPLFRACQARFTRELINNRKLQQSAEQMLFGRGGMFEFVPRYSPQRNGTMKRLPPPLRLADATVDRAGTEGGDDGR